MDAFRKTVERNPNFVAAHAFLAVLLSELGREEEARAEGEKALKLSPGASLEGLRARLPYRNPADLERLLGGMRKAGLQ